MTPEQRHAEKILERALLRLKAHDVQERRRAAAEEVKQAAPWFAQPRPERKLFLEAEIAEMQRKVSTVPADAGNDPSSRQANETGNVAFGETVRDACCSHIFLLLFWVATQRNATQRLGLISEPGGQGGAHSTARKS